MYINQVQPQLKFLKEKLDKAIEDKDWNEVRLCSVRITEVSKLMD